MVYYIKYPRSMNDIVSVVTRRPKPSKRYDFAEGPFKTIDSVIRRLNMMEVPAPHRPAKFR